MKSVIVLFTAIFLIVSSSFAQDWMQYVSKQCGDTLFVKDDVEFGSSSTLYLLMASDSLSPATRVYMLKNGGLYSIVNNPVTSSVHRTIIMGQTQTSLKVSKCARPPVICGASETGIAVYGGMNINKDLLIKNIDLELGNLAGNNGGWAYFGFSGAGMRLQVDNCIMEHTWWVWVGAPPADSRIFFTNDYFVNLSGQACRRNGGVTDFNGKGVTHQDTLVVENCTHVNTQGSLYKFRYGVSVGNVLFNHNDFIDCAGHIMMNIGDQTNMSVTNNIFVNCQLQAYAPPLDSADVGEVDMDGLPMGLVNLGVDSTFNANGKNFYADKNLVYWDPSLSDIVQTLNNNAINGSTAWVSQMIDMNSRTAALFNDNANYPILINGTWIKNKLPAFRDTKDLFTTRLAIVKAYAIAAVDIKYQTPMPSWRQPGNEESANFVYADWPIPIDLSYTDADLMTAGLGGFPIGDLNWFPVKNAVWSAQRDVEHNYIKFVLISQPIVDVKEQPAVANRYELEQNYPNPFNPATVINYSIPKASNVTLKVYDILGNEVATLVNKFQTANSYQVDYNAASLASGVYFYTIQAGNFTLSRKMLLLK
jgi:hypothetical protein